MVPRSNTMRHPIYLDFQLTFRQPFEHSSPSVCNYGELFLWLLTWFLYSRDADKTSNVPSKQRVR